MHIDGLKATLIGAVWLGALSTLGDAFWANLTGPHLQIYGIVHGAILFFSIGLVLGAVSKRPISGGIAGVLIGAAAAGSFYLLRPTIGRWTMVILYVGAWMGLSAVHARLSARSAGGTGAVTRGVLAAVLSGAAFYLASGVWRPFNPVGWDYLTHFFAWTFAYLPGFAALLLAKPRAASLGAPA
jgi:hypothetical protein